MAEEWDISPGTTLLRSELHDRWGGARFGGIEPAPRAESVFLFYKPDVRSAFGYDYDGAQPDGTFHYTGDGQVGDQLPTVGGNKSLLDAGEGRRGAGGAPSGLAGPIRGDRPGAVAVASRSN